MDRFSYKGLSPYKFMPMLGVHKTPNPTQVSIAALRGGFLGGAGWLKRYIAKTI
jgi:hypothetical protein